MTDDLIERTARAIDAASKNARLGQDWKWFDPEARAAIAIIAPAVLDMAADWLHEAADQAAEDLGDRLFEINRDQRTKNVFTAQPYFDAVATAILAIKAQFQTEGEG